MGLGLIGGSIARAVAARRDWPVSAWDPDRGTLRAAARAGLITAAPDPERAVAGAELTVLAAPPLANLALVERLGPALAVAGTTLTDVSSAKGAMAARAERIAGLRFVGGHPLSGRTERGFASSRADLFVGRPWVVVAGGRAQARDVARVRALARACRARPLDLGADEHDRAVAAISHLPLLVSAALAEAALEDEAWPIARVLAAQGFRDTTRLARGDPTLGAGILATNPAAVSVALGRLAAVLETWRAELMALAETTADRSIAAAASPGSTAEPPPAGPAARLERRLARVRSGLGAEVRLP